MLLITFCKGCALHGLLTTSASCGGSGEAIKGHRVLTTSAACGGSGETIKGHRVLTKILRVVQITATILLIFSLHVAARSVSQTITLSGKNIPLKTVFAEIEKQSGYLVVSNKELIDDAKPVSINVTDYPLLQFLDETLTPQGLGYLIENKTIFLKKHEQKISTYNKEKNPPVSGIIRGPDGQPLSGVNVMIKGTKKGTVTDKEGRFSIEAEEGAELEISSIGFGKKIVAVSSSRELFVSLEIASSVLDEVQYIAYGQTSKRFSVGNIGTLKAADIEKQPVNNPLLALQGRVPGLQVTQTSGMPGAGVIVRIQGQNSLGNGNGPLYVVDGVPVSTEIPFPFESYGPLTSSGESYVRKGNNGVGNTLNYINPLDIESIEVLKDADATAIYGSRAANGAILITTKRGKSGKASLTADVQQGWGEVGHFMDLLNTSQYLEMRREALNNDGLTPGIADRFDPGYAPDILLWDTTRSTNWQEELIGGKANYTNLTAGITGGTTALQYRISGTYHTETSVFPGDFSNKRGSIHFSLNNDDVNQKFHFLLSTNYTNDKNTLPKADLTRIALTLVPVAPSLYNDDGSLNWYPYEGNSTFFNPLAKTLYQTYDSKTTNLVANAILGYDLLPGLRVSSTFGFSNLESNDYQLNSLLAESPEMRYLPGMERLAIYGDSKFSTWIIEPQANYKRMIGKGRLDALIGTTFQNSDKEAGYLAGVGFNNDQVMRTPSAATTLVQTGYVKSLYKYNALYSRINYTYADKYIMNLTGRRDGSSRFGSDNRFHNFWSAGAGWIFTREKFFTKNFSFLSFGKVSGNYGTVGSDQIGDYRFLTLYNINNPAVPYQGTTGLTPADLPNPYLQWEETKKLSLGVDVGFLKDRIYVNVNYSQNKSSNQLLDYYLPQITGRPTVLSNFPATVKNTNWEFSLNSQNIINKDFKWTTTFNLTIPRNKLVEFPNLVGSPYEHTYVVGKPVDIQKLLQHAGVNPNTGLYQIVDSTGKFTSINTWPDDYRILISGFPKLYGGIQNILQYKGFQLDVFIQYVNQTAPSPEFGLGYSPGRFYFFDASGNQTTTVMNRWQKVGDDARIQKFTASDYNVDDALNNAISSDAANQDASFVRIENVSLSWELPLSAKKKLNLQNFKLYVQGQNLLTITDYKGLDPENVGYNTLPPLRVITFGLQATL